MIHSVYTRIEMTIYFINLIFTSNFVLLKKTFRFYVLKDYLNDTVSRQ